MDFEHGSHKFKITSKNALLPSYWTEIKNTNRSALAQYMIEKAANNPLFQYLLEVFCAKEEQDSLGNPYPYPDPKQDYLEALKIKLSGCGIYYYNKNDHLTHIPGAKTAYNILPPWELSGAGFNPEKQPNHPAQSISNDPVQQHMETMRRISSHNITSQPSKLKAIANPTTTEPSKDTNLLGAAAGPIIPGGKWAKNAETSGSNRSTEEAFAFLQNTKLFEHPDISDWLQPDDVIFIFMDDTELPFDEDGKSRVPASYYHRAAPPDGYQHRDVHIAEMTNRNGQFIARLNKRLLESDTELIHTYAHELYEIGRMKEEFEQSNGSMPASKFNRLSKYDGGTSHHEKAHDFANKIIKGFNPFTGKLSA